MLQHNISRDSTLKTKVSVLIDADTFDLKNNPKDPILDNSNSLEVIFENSLDRVSKINIDEFYHPKIYNVNRHNTEFTLSTETDERNYIIEIGDLSQTIQSIETEYLNNPLDGLIFPEFPISFDVKTDYDTPGKEKLLFEIGGVVPSPEITLRLGNLSKLLGYDFTKKSIKGWISDVSSIDLTQNIVISEGLGNNEFKYMEFNLLGSIEKVIKIPDATYDIYTLGNILKKSGINVIYGNSQNKYIIFSIDTPIGALIVSNPFSDIFNFVNDQPTKYLLEADESYKEASREQKIALRLDYTVLTISQGTTYDFVIEPGYYTEQTLLDSLNSQFPANWVFSYSEITGRFTITPTDLVNLWNYTGGLRFLLGDNLISLGDFLQGEYTFPRGSQLNIPYININSIEISRLLEERTKVLNRIGQTFDVRGRSLESNNSAVSSNVIFTKFQNQLSQRDQNELYLSRKENIKMFDLYFTNHLDEIIDFNNNSVKILMTFTIS